MVKKRILVLGAGLAGLSAAWHLQRKGVECRVLEKESQVGGLCRSKQVNGFTPLEMSSIQPDKAKFLTGFTFDYSGHLLHFRHQYTFNLVKDLLGNNLARHERSSWVYIYGRYLPYPFQVHLYGLPEKARQECLAGFAAVAKQKKVNGMKDGNFLSWINHTFGKGIAKYFMIPYNRKFWTVPPSQLTCAWLDGFIPVPSLNQIIEGTISESRRQFGYNAHFWYPKKGGINEVPLALANRIKHIFTDCHVVEIDLDKKEIKMTSGDREKFDYLISTIPLPQMPHLIKRLPNQIRSACKKLRWNSIFNLNLGVERRSDSERHWIYFPQKEIAFFRVGFFHNFSLHLAPAGKGSLYVEVAYSQDKPIDKNRIISEIKDGLKAVGILSSRDAICVQDINDIHYGYPIYDIHYHSARERILDFLNQNSIFPCGRYGSWRYMSMEDSLLEGRRLTNLL